MFYPKSSERVERTAKAFVAYFSQRHDEKGRPIVIAGFSYAKCLDIVSRMYGFRDFPSLKAGIPGHAPSKEDHIAGAAVSESRRLRHVDILVLCGLVRRVAEEAVDTVRPTG
jgi:hypothetical protein